MLALLKHTKLVSQSSNFLRVLKQGIKHYNLTDFDYLITYDDSTSKDKPEASLLLVTKQGEVVFTNNGTNYINALDSNYNLTDYV